MNLSFPLGSPSSVPRVCRSIQFMWLKKKIDSENDFDGKEKNMSGGACRKLETASLREKIKVFKVKFRFVISSR